MAKQVLVSVGRVCKTCEIWKPAESFPHTPSGGLRGSCVECRRASQRRPHQETQCAQCGATFLMPRSDSRFCTQRCYGESRQRKLGVKPRKPFVGTEKRCTRCGFTKPVADFQVRNSWGEDRPGAWCRQCVTEDSRRRYAARRDGHRSRGRHLPDGTTHLLVRDGYVIEKAKGHHRAGKNGWVLQHILVAEAKYGFPIPPEITVHHKNNDKADNRPENLELRIGNHGVHGDLIPTILRVPEFREIARRILAQYDD